MVHKSKWGEEMAFSKGKRIEDETSKRIIDLSVNIGCKEGPDALTVTRICKELNCDRRVVYNRFRDVDEISLIVSGRCCDELIESASEVINTDELSFDAFISFVEKIFNYIYEKNAYFQHYISLYKIDDTKIKNRLLQELLRLVNVYKNSGLIIQGADVRSAAQNIWLLITGASNILSNNEECTYEDFLKSVLSGAEAVFKGIYIDCNK